MPMAKDRTMTFRRPAIAASSMPGMLRVMPGLLAYEPPNFGLRVAFRKPLKIQEIFGNFACLLSIDSLRLP